MRLLHSMFYVTNIEQALTFYTAGLGMKVLRKIDYKKDQFTRYFVGYIDENDGAVLELTYEWGGGGDRKVGNVFGHLGIEVTNIDQSYQQCLDNGGIGEKAPHKPNTTVLAFLRDPNGVQIELVQKKNI